MSMAAGARAGAHQLLPPSSSTTPSSTASSLAPPSSRRFSAGRAKGSSFLRKAAASAGDVLAVGARAGPHGTSLVSSGLSDLDEILGGGIPVGGIVMVMEDLEAPHHMLLMRYFMAQGLAHGQPLLFASPLPSPKSFLGTLPGLGAGEEQKSRGGPEAQGEDLRIAWQYRRYLNEQQELANRRLRQQEQRASSMSSDQHLSSSGHRQEYSTQFDLRKLLDRSLWTAPNIQCLSLQGGSNFASLQEKCAQFFGSLARNEGGGHQVGRIALHSLCAPQCMLSVSEWEMLAFLHGIKSRLREARAVAFITFPSALLKDSVCSRWQHVSDILLSVEAVRDDDKEMESMFTGYKDMVGFLRVHKLAIFNSQVPRVPEVGSLAIKVLQKRKVALERLHLAPIDASGGKGGGASSLLCAQPANAPSVLDF